MPSDRNSAATGPIAIATQCFGPDFGGIEALMTSLADAVTASGREIEVFADHIRRRDAGELARPYPIRRFGSIRPLRRWMKRRALTERPEPGFAGVFADSWKSSPRFPPASSESSSSPTAPKFPENSKTRARAASARRCAAPGRSSPARSSRRIWSACRRFFANRSRRRQPAVAGAGNRRRGGAGGDRARIAGRGPVVSTLSRLEPRKGVDAVLAALPRLRERFPRIVYLVGGGGDDHKRLRALAAALGVEAQVEFLGHLPDDQAKAALFERSDLFAMPVRRVDASVEGFGIVYAEAAWRGVPSLAGAEGGAAEAVLDGKTGFVRRGDDAEAVLAALTTLLADDGLRARMGEAARRRAREDLAWSQALPRYLAALGL